MSSDIPPEHEQFIRRAVEAGWFRDRGEAMGAAVDLLKRRLELLEQVDRGTRDLRGGKHADFNEESLRRFFDEVQTQGEQRYRASQERP